MGRFRVYIKTFDSFGDYNDDWIEVSDDVLKLSEIKQSLDSTEYEIGIYKLSSLKLTLRNDHGYYLDPDNTRSIFEYKRKDTQVKITWNVRAIPLCVGFFKAGNVGPVGEEIEVFRGLITEVTATSDIDNQTAIFDVLGLESLFNRVTVPYSSITNGDDLSDVFYAMLNQATITELLTVSLSNITPGLDQAIDDKSDLENQTVKEALGSGNSLLFLSQSILTTDGQVIEIKPRDPTATVQFSFYGPASQLGNQNIIDLKELREGFNSVRNFWTWEDTSLTAQDTSSVDKFGIEKKEIGSTVITNSTKRQNILNDLRDDFSAAKIELTLIAPLTPETVALKLLDKVDIDYPAPQFPADENPLPRFGQARWGQARFPIGAYDFTIDQLTGFKIISRTIKPKDETIEFKLREV